MLALGLVLAIAVTPSDVPSAADVPAAKTPAPGLFRETPGLVESSSAREERSARLVREELAALKAQRADVLARIPSIAPGVILTLAGLPPLIVGFALGLDGLVRLGAVGSDTVGLARLAIGLVLFLGGLGMTPFGIISVIRKSREGEPLYAHLKTLDARIEALERSTRL